MYTDDFVRFGRGSTVNGVDIDATYTGWRDGDVYIHTDGYPQYDPQSRVTGDANPDWTASIRNSVRIGSNLRLSALVDIKHGGQMGNGTKGALYFFGTPRRPAVPREGKDEIFGETYLTQFEWPVRARHVRADQLAHVVLERDRLGLHRPEQPVHRRRRLREAARRLVAYTFRDQDWLSRSASARSTYA